MGLFRDLGERVERFKQEATDASRAQATYECAACGEPIYTDRETCPHCGSEAVVMRSDGSSDAEDGSSDAEDGNESTEADAEDAGESTIDGEPADGNEPSVDSEG